MIYLQILHSEFNFYDFEKATLQKLENIGSFPPRFVVTYKRNVFGTPLSSTIIVSTGESEMIFQVTDDSDPIKSKNHTV